MKEILVIGLGTGHRKHLTREAWHYLNSRLPLYFRTGHHPVAQYYINRGKGRSFDGLNDQCSFSQKKERPIIRRLLSAVRKHGQICYAVPGHPLVGEAAVKHLLKLSVSLGIKIKIIPGLSFIEPLLKVLKIDKMDGIRLINARSIYQLEEPSPDHLMINELYNCDSSATLKSKLLELYPENYPVTLVGPARMRHKSCSTTPLRLLDSSLLSNPCIVMYLPPYRGYLMGDLLRIMARLRAADGCPWDRKQSNHSLRQYLVEEAYEVVGAIDANDDSALKEELGDVLLQVVFHSRIAHEENRFDFLQVIEGIVSKLIRRHPHVFGNARASNASEVRLKWEEIKLSEKSRQNEHHDEDVPVINVDHSLPALLKAYKLQKKAADIGFDWPCIKGPLEKAQEELKELQEALEAQNQDAIEEELGDYLFTIVNLARFLGVNPELALGKTSVKFMDRFHYVLVQAKKTGRPASDFSLEQLDKWWEEAKKIRKIGK